jgi:hypothetical protein
MEIFTKASMQRESPTVMENTIGQMEAILKELLGMA